MTLKIELIEGRIRLIGEFRSERLDQVKAEIDRRGSQSFWIWRSWIDVDGIRFLNAYEAKGISVSHCSPYIRAWMAAEREPSGANAKEENGTVAIRHEHSFAHPK